MIEVVYDDDNDDDEEDDCRVSGDGRSLGFRPLFFGGSNSPSRSVNLDLVHGFALLSNVDKRHTDRQSNSVSGISNKVVQLMSHGI